MHEYYRPSGNPDWVNDDWIRKNLQVDPDNVSVDVIADLGCFQVKVEEPTNHSPHLYNWFWGERIEYPYCIRYVEKFEPWPLYKAKAWMLETYPDYAADIEAAPSVDELQQILDSIPQT